MGEPLYDWFGIQLTFTTAGVILAETFVALPFFVITVEGRQVQHVVIGPGAVREQQPGDARVGRARDGAVRHI